MKCRFCNKQINRLFFSFGSSPLANSYLTIEQLQKMEPFYPLEVYVCDNCLLVQVQEFQSSESIFGNYSYMSSYSDTWLRHAEDYVHKAIGRFGLNRHSFIIEVASNDGYLLQYFVQKDIPVLGIEPARNVAEIAIKKGVPTQAVFFGVETAKQLASEGKYADLLLGNNVLAHVPDLNDFVEGFKILLKPDGIITMEFPHLVSLIKDVQFDTIYHEHFSYFSFTTVEKVFLNHGLVIFDVEKLATHGGSLRIHARHQGHKMLRISDRVYELRQQEKEEGCSDINYYAGFNDRVKKVKLGILKFLLKAKEDKKVVVGYGAPAKGVMLINYCGIKNDLIDYTVDISPYKQGLFLPGSHIPIEHPNKINQTKPDYIFILPWNIKDEIMDQLSFVKDWGAKFVIPVPKVQVI